MILAKIQFLLNFFINALLTPCPMFRIFKTICSIDISSYLLMQLEVVLNVVQGNIYCRGHVSSYSYMCCYSMGISLSVENPHSLLEKQLCSCFSKTVYSMDISSYVVGRCSGWIQSREIFVVVVMQVFLYVLLFYGYITILRRTHLVSWESNYVVDSCFPKTVYSMEISSYVA